MNFEKFLSPTQKSNLIILFSSMHVYTLDGNNSLDICITTEWGRYQWRMTNYENFSVTFALFKRVLLVCCYVIYLYIYICDTSDVWVAENHFYENQLNKMWKIDSIVLCTIFTALFPRYMCACACVRIESRSKMFNFWFVDNRSFCWHDFY